MSRVECKKITSFFDIYRTDVYIRNIVYMLYTKLLCDCSNK